MSLSKEAQLKEALAPLHEKIQKAINWNHVYSVQ